MSQPHQVEVVSRAIEAFLVVRPARRLLDDELREALRLAMSPVDPPREWPAPEDAPHRIMVCWRLARALAIVLGICAEDEALDRATETEGPSPFVHPVLPRISPSQQALIRRGYASELATVVADEGVALLPPTDQGRHAERWCRAAGILARELKIPATQDGYRGLIGLLDPYTCARSGVRDAAILALEDLLVDEAGRLIIEVGERPAIEHFRERYGFARKEAVGLIRLARADALAMGSSSIEEDRAIMVAQLKSLVARAKEEMNTDRELRALKELARVQGLTRVEPEDMQRMFASMIANVAQAQDKKLLEAHAVVVRQIDGPPPDDLTGREPIAEPEVETNEEPEEYVGSAKLWQLERRARRAADAVLDAAAKIAAAEDDEEALADFDKENAR